ncbi:hypothetical protein SH1V18_03170 [Vallitalea longa]|uniref:Uncharacterized protein n=1 Tax=Vallitalea longa TaxID=2936439 RepID=A0A9W5Y7H1_9FIRM|nr:DUF2971 domain-containing protein [Vallitalea longa]GKX27837.1 hypothetical protein SH1V18_03170 [Vallitalea longa]
MNNDNIEFKIDTWNKTINSYNKEIEKQLQNFLIDIKDKKNYIDLKDTICKLFSITLELLKARNIEKNNILIDELINLQNKASDIISSSLCKLIDKTITSHNKNFTYFILYYIDEIVNLCNMNIYFLCEKMLSLILNNITKINLCHKRIYKDYFTNKIYKYKINDDKFLLILLDYLLEIRDFNTMKVICDSVSEDNNINENINVNTLLSFYYGIYYLENNNCVQAEVKLKQCIIFGYKLFYSYMNLVTMYIKYNKTKKAKELLKLAQEKFKNNKELQLEIKCYLCYVLYYEYNYKKALKQMIYLENDIQEYKSNSYLYNRYYNLLGTLYAFTDNENYKNSNNVEDAISCFNKTNNNNLIFNLYYYMVVIKKDKLYNDRLKEVINNIKSAIGINNNYINYLASILLIIKYDFNYDRKNFINDFNYMNKICDNIENEFEIPLAIDEQSIYYTCNEIYRNTNTVNYSELIILLYDLLNTVNTIKDKCVVKAEDIHKYAHYCNLNTAGILANPNGKIRLTNSNCLNDPDEGKLLYDYFNDVKYNDLLKVIDSETNSEIYLISFCKGEDDLNLFRFYGDDAKGASIILNKEFFDDPFKYFIPRPDSYKEFKMNEKDYIEGGSKKLYKVIYPGIKDFNNKINDIKIKVDNILHFQKNKKLSTNKCKIINKCINNILSQIRYLIKANCWKSEHEARLILKIPKENNKIEYDNNMHNLYYYLNKDYKITLLTLGSKVGDYQKEANYFSSLGIKKVKKSKHHYQ